MEAKIDWSDLSDVFRFVPHQELELQPKIAISFRICLVEKQIMAGRPVRYRSVSKLSIIPRSGEWCVFLWLS